MGYLDEIARRRIAAVLLIAVTVAAVMAIADIGPFSDPPTAEESVQESVEEFFGAAREGDFKSVCDRLARKAHALVLYTGARLGGGKKLDRCHEVLEAQAGEGLRRAAAEVHRVRVSGYSAVAEVRLRSPRTKGVEERSIELQLEDGEWLIADFAG